MWSKLIFISLLIGLLSCKTKEAVVHDLERRSSNELTQCITDSNISPEWFSSRISTDLTAKGETNSFTTSLRMRKDSVIWLSIRKGPIIVASVLLSPDSVKVLIKINEKRYLQTDFNYIRELLNVELDYYMIQDMVLGNAVGYDPEENYKKLKDSTHYLLSTHSLRQIEKAYEKLPRREDKQYVQRYWLNPEDCKVAKTLINNLSDTSNLQIIYEDFKVEDDLKLPNNLQINGNTPRDTVTALLNYSRFKINKPLTFPFKVTDKYERIEIVPNEN